MKYDKWKINTVEAKTQRQFEAYSPLLSMVLCCRGYLSPDQANGFLNPEEAASPFLLADIDKAVTRIKQALSNNEKIAVFGDYDVDGITASSLLYEYLLSEGAICEVYIPDRIEEGYGLGTAAIEQLAARGVRLIITVDCGITAIDEAALAHGLGVDLIITDHHQCPDKLPDAVAVINPLRRDCLYPYKTLAGAGVSFKLVCALAGENRRSEIYSRFSELAALGTVADIMPLTGENRDLVRQGLEQLKQTKRPGLRMLINESGAKTIGVTTIGYALAPRINAAGRMCNANLALKLILTRDDKEAELLAQELCRLNDLRRHTELGIYQSALAMLEQYPPRSAIVLAHEDWHQGVVGIVASRLADEFALPAFLICLDGDKGKASCRSFGGFNIFSALEKSSHLLEGFGGHEMAAGFTIKRENIDEFRKCISEVISASEPVTETVLELDGEVPSSLLTCENVEALEALEPCGCGNTQPAFCLSDARLESVSEVGGGKHLRLKLSKSGRDFFAIFFSVNEREAGISVGDIVDVAFIPKINEFRGNRSVQLQLLDIRPGKAGRLSYDAAMELYQKGRHELSPKEAAAIYPSRKDFVALWHYLKKSCGDLTPRALARDVKELELPKLMVCLDVFAELGLIRMQSQRKKLKIFVAQTAEKTDLEKSIILKEIRQRAEIHN